MKKSATILPVLKKHRTTEKDLLSTNRKEKKHIPNPDIDYVKNIELIEKELFSGEELNTTTYDENVLNTINSLKSKHDIRLELLDPDELMGISRREDLLKENNLEKRKEYLENRINDRKNDKKRVTKNICDLQKEIDKMGVDVDFLSNYVKFSQNKDFSSTTNSLDPVIVKRASMDIGFMQRKQQEYSKATLVREGKIKEKCDEREKVIRRRNNFIKQEKVIDNDILDLRFELKNLKEELNSYYSKLLKTGLDVRDEGLSWLIKKIWKLGFELNIGHFPDFLDEQSISFLVEKAKGEINMDKLKRQCDYLRKLAFNANEKSYSQVNDSKWLNFRRGSQSISIVNKSRSMSSVDIVEEVLNKNKNVKIKDIQPYLGEKLDFEEKNLLMDAGTLDEQYCGLRCELNKKQFDELVRLDYEFMFGGYQRHYNVDRNVLVAALVGQRRAAQEMARVNMNMRRYLEKLNRCRTYAS